MGSKARVSSPSNSGGLAAFFPGFGQQVRVLSVNSKGSRCLLASDLRHNGEVHTAAISADNTTLFTSSSGGCIWVSGQGGRVLKGNSWGSPPSCPFDYGGPGEASFVSSGLPHWPS